MYGRAYEDVGCEFECKYSIGEIHRCPDPMYIDWRGTTSSGGFCRDKCDSSCAIGLGSSAPAADDFPRSQYGSLRVPKSGS